ncbi:MAG: ATP-binding cassette domain-containing protein [bacterium]|nr:ATP-binding cassette domain-containing protein [bacterium]
MLEIKDLQIKIDNKILFNVNLNINKGEYFVLLGPSGVGKTLLIETIINLRKPYKGCVLLDGKDVTSLSPENRPVSYLPQDSFLFPHLGVKDNIYFGARERKIPVAEQNKRFDDLVSVLNIKNIIGRDDVRTLSLGEQQRVALARALMVKPEILFLDEPFASVDEYQKRILQLKLKEINRLFKITIFHVTHDREEAFMLGDRLAIMIDGKIRQIGARDDIYYHPTCIEVARFMLNQNIFSGKILEVTGEEANIEIKKGLILKALNRSKKFNAGDQVYCGIRPEEIAVIRPDRPLKPMLQDNLVKGEISEIFEKGGNHILILKLLDKDPDIEVVIPNCAYRDMETAVGKIISVCLKKNSIWILTK